MNGYYYGKRNVVGQTKSFTSNMMAGMNAYHDAFVINDNQLADDWDAYLDDVRKAITFKSVTSNTLLASNLTGTGKVRDAITAKDSSGYERLIVVTEDDADADDAYIDDLHDLYAAGNTKSTTDISSYQLTGTYTSMCTFNTEAKRYVAFCASGTKKLLLYDFTSVTYVSLPFYPKRMVSHYNRIFVIDTLNKLWWCRAGDYSTWYGLELDDDYVVAETEMKNGTYTLLANPDVVRPLMVTVTPTSTLDTMGTLVVVGTDSLDVAQSETITPASGIVYSTKNFKTITSITGAGWTAASGADKIKIGIAPVTGFVQADAGMWTLEQEQSLIDIVAMSGNLYIWSQSNIYVFHGYSYDTFSLTKIIADLGASSSTTSIATNGNLAYFWGSDGELYEYNGDDYPRIINRPIYKNGQVANNIYGSLEAYTGNYNLCAFANTLYVYSDTSENKTTYRQLRFYEFDIISRSWWKRSSFSSTAGMDYSSGYFVAKYIPSVSRASTYNIMCQKSAASTVNWYVYSNTGSDPASLSYIVTKTYNEEPSQELTLTNIIVALTSDTISAPLTTEVNIYYGIDGIYTLAKTILGSSIDTGSDREYFTVNLLNSDIARKKYYNLKITCNSTDAIYLCGIERRYRVTGRSR